MRTKNSIKNTITSFISNIISFVFLFISQTIFIKIMGIEYTGLNGLFSNVLTLLNLFELGIGSAIIYNLYKYISKNNKEQIKSIMKFYKVSYNIIALLIFIVGLCLTPFIKHIVGKTTVDINIYIVYILFIISTVATYVISYKRNLIYAYQKNYILNIIHMIYLVVLNILQLLIIFITKNYYLYLVVKIICILLENIIITIKANKDYPYLLEKSIKPIDKKVKEDVISRVKALFIHKVSGVVTYGTDNILISMFFGLKAVGLYTNYHYIIQTIDTLFRNITFSTNASVGNLLVEKKYKERFIAFNKIRFLNLCITIITSTCLLCLIEPFIILWLGKKYILSKLILFILIVNYYQSMMKTPYNVFKDSAGIWREDKYVPLIQVFLNLISSIVLLKIFGMAGIFMGTIISSLLVWFYSYPKFVYTKLFNRKYKDYYIEMLKKILLSIIIITITYLINISFSIKILLLNLIVKLLISLIVPILILYLVYRKTDEYNYYIYLINKGLKRK